MEPAGFSSSESASSMTAEGSSMDVQSWDAENRRFSSPVGCQDYIPHHGKWREQ